jgi:hypothetical protein
MQTIPSAATVLLIMSIGVASGSEAPIVTPSELNAHADEYDGKAVRVRGWLVLQFEDVGLWDSKEAHNSPHEGGDVAAVRKMDGISLNWPPTCVSVSGKFLNEMEKLESYPAIVDGVFRRHIYPPNVISNQVCNDTGLEVSKISKQNQ